MTIDGFIRTFERLRKKHGVAFRTTPHFGSIRTVEGRGRNKTCDCPLSFVAHKMGKRVMPLAVSQSASALKLSADDAKTIWLSADFGKDAKLYRRLLRAACIKRAA